MLIESCCKGAFRLRIYTTSYDVACSVNTLVEVNVINKNDVVRCPNAPEVAGCSISFGNYVNQYDLGYYTCSVVTAAGLRNYGLNLIITLVP